MRLLADFFLAGFRFAVLPQAVFFVAFDFFLVI